jgi:hypothetical protein
MCSTKNKPGKDVNVQNAKWWYVLTQTRFNIKIAVGGSVLTPASGCCTPNCNSQNNTSQGKAGYTIINTICNYVQIFVENQFIVLYNKGKGVWIL